MKDLENACKEIIRLTEPPHDLSYFDDPVLHHLATLADYANDIIDLINKARMFDQMVLRQTEAPI